MTVPNTETNPAAGGAEKPAESKPAEQMVPLTVVQGIRDELKDAKTQLNAVQHSQSILQQQSQQAAAPKSKFSEMADDEVVNVGEIKQLFAEVLNPLRQQVTQAQMAGTYSDYTDVIKNKLPIALKQNPALADAIQSSNNPYVLAYHIGNQIKDETPADKEPATDLAPAATNVIDKVISNSKKPGSASEAGASGGIEGVNRFATMSNDDFDAHIAKVKRG